MQNDENETAAAPVQPAQTDLAPGEGDFGGAYGYGHPAHKPDPDASYVFDPGPPRTMPVKPEKRWR